MPERGNILVIDDDESISLGCVQTLAGEGYGVQTASDGRDGLAKAALSSFDLILLDLMMPGMPGAEVLRNLMAMASPPAVIIITGYATVDSAVQTMKGGATDYLAKPFTPEALVRVVDAVLKRRLAAMERACMRLAMEEPPPSEAPIACSEAMRGVLDLARKVAATAATVLISGETGVGKEVVARAIHRMGRRRDKPFVTVDCGVLVETLFESEMFGHVRGAFSGALDTTDGKFELARNGTIFLDEVANISVNIQAKLLRVIQEHEITKVGSSDRIHVDVNVISATNRDLEGEIKAGRFREDLFYRLNVVHIHIPPLRERVEDIPPLARQFLKTLSRSKAKKVTGISDEAMRALKIHEWPGNVRELKNAVERAVVVCEGETIERSDLPYDITSEGYAAPDGALAEMERKEIVRVLRQCNWNKTRTAQTLGINRKTLREKIRRYNIDIPAE
jgi:DNA-binding NtrC family response regulator